MASLVPLTLPSPGRRFALASTLLVPALLGAGVGLARLSGSTDQNLWYQSLDLPALQPPGPVFGIVWTILYTLMALAAARVWAAPPSPARSQGLALFGLGLIANWAWSPTFFLAHQIDWALVVLAIVLGFALATAWRFASVSRLAAWLLAPYIAWGTFAFGLNLALWRMNPAASVAQIGI
jgi:tryptophan-rich sensory protein